jgi:hypothetical protein
VSREELIRLVSQFLTVEGDESNEELMEALSYLRVRRRLALTK